MNRGLAGRVALLAAMALGFAALVSVTRSAFSSSDDGGSGTPAVESAESSSSDEPASEPLVSAEDPEDATDVDVTGEETVGTDAVAPVPVKGQVLVVGGSSLAGIEWNPNTKRALQGAEFTLDLESCRRLYLPSCSALRTSAPATAYEVVQQKGPGHHTLIVFGGYNDSGNRFQEGFEKVVEAAREAGIRRVIWANYRQDSDYVPPADLMAANTYRVNNFILDDLMQSGNYPEVEIADWNAYSAEQAHWFSDDVHFSALGAWGAADYLSRKLASLDKKACPQPRRPGEKRQKPCPDPDKKPPDVDYSAVYNFKPGRLLCYDADEPKHIECKPPSKVEDADLTDAVLETLHYGDQGKQVTNLQAKLKRLGLYTGSPSGRYDRDTVVAVMRFQQRKDLPVTGTSEARTRELLGFGCPDASRDEQGKCPVGDEPVVFPWTLERGDKGVRVWVLQQRLRELDFLSAKPNSVFGTNTRTAVKKFQSERGLDDTGVVDAQTARELGFEVP